MRWSRTDACASDEKGGSGRVRAAARVAPGGLLVSRPSIVGKDRTGPSGHADAVFRGGVGQAGDKAVFVWIEVTQCDSHQSQMRRADIYGPLCTGKRSRCTVGGVSEPPFRARLLVPPGTRPAGARSTWSGG